MIRSILAAIFAVLFLIISLPILFVEWIVSKINKEAYDISSLRIVQWAFKCITFIAGTNLVIIGEENVPKDEAVLYIGNHNSIFDVILTYARCPSPTGFIAKDSIKKVPILNIWMSRLYCLFLDRSNPREGLKIILQAIDYIKSGISIFVFPEGTRSKDGQLHEFKEGTFKMATKTDCKIIPVAISGTADMLEGNHWKLKKKTVVISYGTAIVPSQLEGDDKKHIGAYVNTIMSNMLEENKQYL